MTSLSVLFQLEWLECWATDPRSNNKFVSVCNFPLPKGHCQSSKGWTIWGRFSGESVNAGSGIDEILPTHLSCSLTVTWTKFVIFLRTLDVDETARHRLRWRLLHLTSTMCRNPYFSLSYKPYLLLSPLKKLSGDFPLWYYKLSIQLISLILQRMFIQTTFNKESFANSLSGILCTC